MIKFSIKVFIFCFNVRKGSFASRAPVDYSFSAVDESFFVQGDKNFTYGFRETFIECKSFSLPVKARTKPLKLALYHSAGFGFPFPYSFFESFASHIVT